MGNYHPDWNSDDLEPEADPVLRKAVFWHTMMNGAEPSEGLRDEFAAWLQASAAHARAYAEIAALWQGVADMPGPGARGARIGRRSVLLGVVATAGMAASYGWLSRHPFAGIRTAKGEVYRQVLADGTRLELAGQGAFSHDFTPTARHLTLHRGEAWLEIADAEAPATITLGRARIQATRAQLALETGRSGDVLTVFGHSVQVLDQGRQALVSPGQQALISAGGIELTEADPDGAQAWREGRLVYVSQPMARIVDGLNRWGGDEIVIVGRSLSRRPATLILDIADVGQALEQLQQAVPMRVIRAPGRIVFIS